MRKFLLWKYLRAEMTGRIACIFLVLFCFLRVLGSERRFDMVLRTVRVRATAYCPGRCCCGEFADGKTSTGDNAWVLDGVAADPRRLPYRTRIRIPGIGIREVDDTGQAMKRGKLPRIDIRFRTHKEALKFGVQVLDVEVLSSN